MGQTRRRLGVLALLFSVSTAAAAEVEIIAHPGVPGERVTKTLLAQIFLGAVSHWGDGIAIRPVDHSLTSPLRATFSESVLGMSRVEVQQHWMRRMAAGGRPPVTRPTDEEVVAYVAEHPGSIGYVSPDTSLPTTVKVLAVQ